MGAKRRDTKFLQKPKILFVADSVGRNVQFNRLERATNIRIKTAKAYSSFEHKSARWPKLNVTDVTKKELTKNQYNDEYDALVLSAPTVDVTNLDTAKLKPSDNTEFFKEEVINSSKNIMMVAQNALRSNPKLKKVIVLCHPPRFDTSQVDPLSLKQTLAKIANSSLHQLWLDSPYKDKIFIGDHTLDCSTKTMRRMYTDEQSKRLDGIHMNTKAGRRGYTESVLSVLKEALTHQEAKISSPGPASPHSPPAAKGPNTKRTGYPKYHHTVKDSNRFRVFNSNQGNE